MDLRDSQDVAADRPWISNKTPSHIVEVKSSRIGNRIHGAPVVRPDAVPAIADGPIVVSVARAGPRAEVRAMLAAMRFVDGRHYVCAA